MSLDVRANGVTAIGCVQDTIELIERPVQLVLQLSSSLVLLSHQILHRHDPRHTCAVEAPNTMRPPTATRLKTNEIAQAFRQTSVVPSKTSLGCRANKPHASINTSMPSICHIYTLRDRASNVTLQEDSNQRKCMK
jgi:hypothetical protein